MMELNPNYQEILRLDKKLTALHIPHTLERMLDGWCVRCGTTDAIQHFGSYGHEHNLLETWGEDDVVGWKTADQVFELWRQQGQIYVRPLAHTE